MFKFSKQTRAVFIAAGCLAGPHTILILGLWFFGAGWLAGATVVVDGGVLHFL